MSGLQTQSAAANRILTVPNLLSLLRLLGVPVFCWLLLGPHADLAALAVLVLAGVSDWADGRLARALGQTSRLGTLLDPAADRLYILATLVAFVGRGIVPLWLAAALVGRDLILGLVLVPLRRAGYPPLPVNFLGKSATLCLLYGFPFLLFGSPHALDIAWAYPVGWAFTLWGCGLYWWAGLRYLRQATGLLRAVRREAAGESR